jgi:hypothetical protein
MGGFGKPVFIQGHNFLVSSKKRDIRILHYKHRAEMGKAETLLSSNPFWGRMPF